MVEVVAVEVMVVFVLVVAVVVVVVSVVIFISLAVQVVVGSSSCNNSAYENLTDHASMSVMDRYPLNRKRTE